MIVSRFPMVAAWLSLTLLACGESQPDTSNAPTSLGGAPMNLGGTVSGGGMSGGAGTGAMTAGTSTIAGGGGRSGEAGNASSGTGGSGGSGGSGGDDTAGAGSSMGGNAGSGGAPPTCTSLNPVRTVFTIGDSTMSVYDSKAYPRMGWAQPLGDLFTPSCAHVVDKALSGRSSKSFMDEGAWKPIKDALKTGDFVLIQFGHNDEKSNNPALYTDPQTTYKQFLTTYVNDTRTKQATPILLTSINRNNWSGDTLSDTHGGYPPAVRELAQALDVPLIDLEALTRGYFERIGKNDTAKLFMILTPGQWPNYPSGVTDNTHLQEKGARTIGQLAMADAYARRLPFAGLLKGMPVAP